MKTGHSGMHDDDPLCCCEYISEVGERSHILACLCDCEALDTAFDRLLKCRRVPAPHWSLVKDTVMDRIRVPWLGGAKRVETDVISPIILLPSALLLACHSWTMLMITFSALPFALFFIHRRCSRNRTRTKFFLSWTVSSLVVLLGVFQLEVVPYLEILFSENTVLMLAVGFTCLCAYLVHNCPPDVLAPSITAEPVGKSAEATACSVSVPYTETEDSKCSVCQVVQPPRCSHCHLCGRCFLKRDHHCVWLDTCIGEKNHRAFILGLVGLLVSLVYGANLTLTTVCRPKMLWDTFLIPDNCFEVYEDIHISLCFVSAVYALLVAIPVALMLLQQLWLVAINTTIYEMRRHRIGIHSHGVCNNCRSFWCPSWR
ncbi:palmitoyltransferase ZDHHC23 isoform X1 [Dermacentor andersoni]|uniref:palmitoyltransferase ZDHHC23 isoform X1 n=2 Tax=Dermacentor andersoni TaxID=34620 RepID=UPI002155B7FB|nr:palmitoyltransferase ZDHHC23-like isoform X1 [Dermacentor andersoni]